MGAGSARSMPCERCSVLLQAMGRGAEEESGATAGGQNLGRDADCHGVIALGRAFFIDPVRNFTYYIPVALSVT